MWSYCKFFCEALSQRNEKYVKLSISLLAPKFHLVTIVFKQVNVLQTHLISWHNQGWKNLVFWWTKVHAPQSKFRRMLCTLKFCAPCDVTNSKRLPHCVPHCAPNQIDYEKKNVEINLGTAIFSVFFLIV